MQMTRDPLNTVMDRVLRPRRPPVPLARNDVLLALGMCLAQTAMAASAPPSDGHTPTVLGWALLTCSGAVLALRRRAPWLTVAVIVACVGPYHAQDFSHSAAVPAALVALYSMAAAGPPWRSFTTLGVLVGIMATVMGSLGATRQLGEMLRSSGWLVVCVLVGEAIRIHRNYVAAVVERAERAERTREEEAARRVAQERLRIARDLHDLLAHSITLIGVQTSVAAHVLVADPDRLDREAVAKALDGISDTCRGARTELRTTLEVLRAGDADGMEPLPGLSSLPDLARAACDAGARVELSVRRSAHDLAPEPAVGAAAYRIVQEALTNAVRHAGASVGVRAVVEGAGAALRVSVVDDGGAADPAGTGAAAAEQAGDRAGFGIVGMRERARSVGGTLEAGPRTGRPGYAVTALLPARLTPAPSTQDALVRKEPR